MAKLFIYLGFILILLGFILHYFDQYFSWFGNLPGDIRIDNKKIKILIPFSSMLLISILFSIIINFFKKFLS